MGTIGDGGIARSLGFGCMAAEASTEGMVGVVDDALTPSPA